MNYVPSTKQERQEMLAAIGKNNIEELFSPIPASLRVNGRLNLPDGLTEIDIMNRFTELAGKNTIFNTIFRGAGAYKHYIPSVVKHLSSREEFVTAYTPYQAEISQGVLQAIFEYQTEICMLTGMDVSNASVYDGATAAAEAISMCRERKQNTALVSDTIHPKTMEVLKTYCHALGISLEIIPAKNGQTDMEALKKSLTDETACVYMEQPNFYGLIEDAEKIGGIVNETKAKFIMGCYPIALGLLKSPAQCGAHIVVGEGQPLGMPLSFGGPYLGFMTCKKELMRKLPGRIVGQTTDLDGKRAFVLTLQAREQHIRREKSSSSLCSNQALCALTAAIYLGAMGPEGLSDVATQSMSKAHYLAGSLTKINGFSLVYDGEFFNEFVTTCPVPTNQLLEKLEKENILGGYPLPDGNILWCATEMNTKVEMDALVSVIEQEAVSAGSPQLLAHASGAGRCGSSPQLLAHASGAGRCGSSPQLLAHASGEVY